MLFFESTMRSLGPLNLSRCRRVIIGLIDLVDGLSSNIPYCIPAFYHYTTARVDLYLFIVCHYYRAFFGHRRTIRPAIPFGENARFLLGSNLQNPSVRSIYNKEDALGVHNRPLQEDLLKLTCKAAPPLRVLAQTPNSVWDSEVDVGLDSGGHRVKVHSCGVGNFVYVYDQTLC